MLLCVVQTSSLVDERSAVWCAVGNILRDISKHIWSEERSEKRNKLWFNVKISADYIELFNGNTKFATVDKRK